MLIPKGMNKTAKAILCVVLCAAHGFLYGVMYAPAQALMYGMNFKAMVAWILAGIPFDITHGLGNLVVGFLILPMERALNIAKKVLH